MSKICFIVGHGKSKSGGYDSGAVSKDGKYHEFKIAREIAKYAQQYYNANYSEQCDLMNYEGNIYLSDRIKKANEGNYDFVAEFHLNAGGGIGTECFYSKGSTKGMCYAERISASISRAFDVRNRGSKTKTNSSGKDYFGIIRQTKAEAVLIETMFIDTASDLEKISTAEGQKICGEVIAEAIASVRGAKKKVVVPTTTVKPVATPTKPKAKPAKSYYPRYTGKSTRVDEVFKAIGVPAAYRGNWKNRKSVATANGITGYVGSATQNTKLISLAKQGLLVKP